MLGVDIEYIKAILRFGIVVILIATYVVFEMCARLIGNKRLVNIVRKVLVFILVNIIARVGASIIDTYLGYEIAIFSTVVNYLFYIYILAIGIKFLIKLRNKEAEIHTTGALPMLNPRFINKGRVSELLDEIFDEFKINIQRTDDLKEAMKQHISK